MNTIEIPTLPTAKVASRAAAGEALLEEARKNADIWVLTADLMHSTGVEPFALELPDRFINVGIAEQTMLGIAAGLATCGKIPFAATFAFLHSMRACEQVRTDIAYPNLNVKLYGTHSGVSFGQGGTTHHATEDIGILRAIANITVLVPSDVYSVKKAVVAAAYHPGPVYLRLRRGNDPLIYSEELDFRIGIANTVRQGSDVTLIGCGRTVAECILAAEILAQQGISARVVDMHTLKPVDENAILEAARQTQLIVTVEDHNIFGGLGSAVAEVLAEAGSPARLKRLGFRDVYAGIGPEAGLWAKHGLSCEKIAETVKGLLDENS